MLRRPLEITQFTNEGWIERLKSAGVAISMDGKGRWIDNIFIERLWQLADLLAQLPDLFFAILSHQVVPKDRRQVLQHLRLPRRDLVRMNLAVRGDLCNRILATDGFQGYLCLETR
jgi:transposase InsO family protein